MSEPDSATPQTALEYQPAAKKELDPDHYRMTIGEHLEELRVRLILGLGGFLIAFILCLIFVRGYVLPAFIHPLMSVLHEYGVNPQIYFTQMSDPFMVYLRVSLISAAVIASPWMLLQLWRFIAAGLYTHEREIVTRYVPLSLALLISGVVFVYYLVLPWTLKFFMAFSLTINMPSEASPTTVPATTAPAVVIEQFRGDPQPPVSGQLWIDTISGKFKIYIDGKVRVLPFGPENLTSPIITLPSYIDLVFGMLLTFGLSFQMPLAVMALVAVGIVEKQFLRESRQYIYFAMAIVAAVITPGDVITATVALMVPLCLLFEMGIWLSREPGTTTDGASDR